jgi:hypothetical protein
LLAKAKEVADTMSLAWVGVGSTVQVSDSVIDESELQTNPIPYGHMTVDNVPIVETVRLPIYGRAASLAYLLGQSNIAEAGTVSADRAVVDVFG